MTDDNWKDKSTFVCESCMWYVEKSEQLGRCRRHSPEVGNGWPVVYKTDWCGDHKMNASKAPLIKVDLWSTTATWPNGFDVSKYANDPLLKDMQL